VLAFKDDEAKRAMLAHVALHNPTIIAGAPAFVPLSLRPSPEAIAIAQVGFLSFRFPPLSALSHRAICRRIRNSRP
jgi:hypothetical protein